ncbi:hypothetical protein BZG36_02812 [Bifiguratus adelaidae]|uniref:Glycylpeptide N-tetradecanoyltransferase n=1 Tax=Bifiguratus adelaidae TaxID=1938954 RepID=A0A261Y1I4_9FUNG|nr:hypothetical protein BZG36_02812 [Bifiguratus adelaidae]
MASESKPMANVEEDAVDGEQVVDNVVELSVKEQEMLAKNLQKVVKKAEKAEKKERKKGDTGDDVTADNAELTAKQEAARASLQAMLAKLSVAESKSKGSTGDHKFWNTQPVPQLGEVIAEDGPIEPDTPADEIRKEPYLLPKDFEWYDLDMEDEAQLKELYELLSNNYVEDTDSTLRFNYSAAFLKWALQPPGWKKSWHTGIRVTSTKKMVAFISGVPMHLRIHKKTLFLTEINFLCIHKKLRSKRLAPVLIKEITRRSHLEGVFQAVYTAGVVLPKPITTCRYFHRSINPKKLVETGFSYVPRNSTITRMIKSYKLPEKSSIPGLRPMRPEDAEQILELSRQYMSRFDIAPELQNVEEIKHHLLPVKDVVWSYVVENPSTKKVTDFFSFYSLPSKVIGNPKHDTISAAYLFYYASHVPENAQDDKREADKYLSQRLKSLINDALIIARDANFDVFNCLDLMDNALFVGELKFKPGDGFLNYYLYNWRCKDIKKTKTSALSDHRIGIVGKTRIKLRMNPTRQMRSCVQGNIDLESFDSQRNNPFVTATSLAMDDSVSSTRSPSPNTATQQPLTGDASAHDIMTELADEHPRAKSLDIPRDNAMTSLKKPGGFRAHFQQTEVEGNRNLEELEGRKSKSRRLSLAEALGLPPPRPRYSRSKSAVSVASSISSYSAYYEHFAGGDYRTEYEGGHGDAIQRRRRSGVTEAQRRSRPSSMAAPKSPKHKSFPNSMASLRTGDVDQGDATMHSKTLVQKDGEDDLESQVTPSLSAEEDEEEEGSEKDVESVTINPHGVGAAKALLMLCKAFVGTGVMFLPRAFYNGGIIFAPIFMALIASICLFSFRRLVLVRLKIGGSFDQGVADIAFFNSSNFGLFIGTAVFSFEGIGLVLPITDTLKDSKQFSKVLTMTIIIVCTIFCTVGVLSYLAYGPQLQTAVILNLPAFSGMTQAIQILYTLTIILSSPLMLFPAISILDQGIWQGRRGSRSWKVKWSKNVFRVCVAIFCAAVSYGVGSDNLDKFVSLVGSLLCCPLLFLFPAMFHWKICKTPYEKITNIILFLWGLLAMLYTLYVTINSWIHAASAPPNLDICAGQ